MFFSEIWYLVSLVHNRMFSVDVHQEKKNTATYMYVVSGSKQRMIMLMEEDRRLGMSPNITHGDLAPDRMSSTKLRRVSVTKRKTAGHFG